MTAKEYLLQAYLLEKRIDGKMQQIEALRNLATRSTAIIRMDPGGGSGDGDFMENTIIKIVDMEREITEEMERLMDLKQEITGTIKQVDDPALRTLLELRYLCYRNWPEIMSAMHCANTTIHRMHRNGLKKIEEILKTGSKWHKRNETAQREL